MLMRPRRKPVLRMFHGLARCGGTVINRCLGTMQSVVVLSEINPNDSLASLLMQSRDWFHLFGPRETRIFRLCGRITRKKVFASIIRLLRRRAERRGSKLVIRAWNHPDFFGIPLDHQPTYAFSGRNLLKQYFDIKSFVILRHPVDQYLSCVARKGMTGLDLDTFLHGYLRFAKSSRNEPPVRFEDFVDAPDKTLRRICRLLEIPFDSRWQQTWTSYTYVTGDVGQPRSSRGLGLNQIAKLPRRQLAPELHDRLEKNAVFRECLELAGYKFD